MARPPVRTAPLPLLRPVPPPANPWRTADNRPICYFCHLPGHVARFCYRRDFRARDGDRSAGYAQGVIYINNQATRKRSGERQSRASASTNNTLRPRLSLASVFVATFVIAHHRRRRPAARSCRCPGYGVYPMDIPDHGVHAHGRGSDAGCVVGCSLIDIHVAARRFGTVTQVASLAVL